MEVINHSFWLMLSYQSIGVGCYSIFKFFQQKTSYRLFFGLFMLSFGISYFTVHLYLFDHHPTLIYLFPLTFSSTMLVTPFYYLYQKSLFSSGHTVIKNELKHFFPSLMIFFILLPFYILILSGKVELLDTIYGKLLLKDNPEDKTFLIEFLISTLVLIQLLTYAFIFIRKRNKRKLFTQLSTTGLQGLPKAMSYSNLLFILSVLWLLGARPDYISFQAFGGFAFVFVMLLLNTWLTYLNLQYHKIAFSVIIPSESIDTKDDLLFSANQDATHLMPAIEDHKYNSSCLCKSLKEELMKSLEILMHESEPFINPKLKIDDVAVLLGTNTKYLSQVINETYGKNFHTYLNDHRCAKVIRLFEDKTYDEYSIEGIASTCGFNSRSSFVASFKKYTGKLPSAYRHDMKVISSRKKSVLPASSGASAAKAAAAKTTKAASTAAAKTS